MAPPRVSVCLARLMPGMTRGSPGTASGPGVGSSFLSTDPPRTPREQEHSRLSETCPYERGDGGSRPCGASTEDEEGLEIPAKAVRILVDDLERPGAGMGLQELQRPVVQMEVDSIRRVPPLLRRPRKRVLGASTPSRTWLASGPATSRATGPSFALPAGEQGPPPTWADCPWGQPEDAYGA